MTSFNPNYLPKAPPLNTVMLGFRASTCEFGAGGDTKQSIADTVSDSGLPLIFKRHCQILVLYEDVWQCPQLSEKAITTLLSFPTTHLSKARFSSHASTKWTYPNGLNREACMRTPFNIFSETDVRFTKKENKLLSWFCFREYSYLS